MEVRLERYIWLTVEGKAYVIYPFQKSWSLRLMITKNKEYEIKLMWKFINLQPFPAFTLLPRLKVLLLHFDVIWPDVFNALQIYIFPFSICSNIYIYISHLTKDSLMGTIKYLSCSNNRFSRLPIFCRIIILLLRTEAKIKCLQL